MNRFGSRALIAVASTLGVVALLVLLGGHFVWQKQVWAAEKLAEIEPRHARLLGLRDAGASLEQGLKQMRAAASQLGYPAERDAAQVGIDLQQVARKALQAAGLAVANSQVRPARSEAGFDRIGVALQAEGSLRSVQLALAALQAERPTLMIDDLVLQWTGRSAEDRTPIVSCRLTVSVLRLQS